MAQALFTNNAFSLLASGITDSATTLTVTASDGALFPNPTGGNYFYATLIDTSNNLEIVQCTARSTDSLTIVRGAEGTTNRAYSAGDRIELRITAAGIVEADGFVGPTDESSDTTTFPLFVNAATGSQLPHTGSNFTFNSNTGALVTTLYDGIIGSVTPAAGSFTTITGSGVASIDDTTDTTSGTSGSIHTDGGVGIAKKLFVGTSATITGVLTMGGNIVSDTDSTDDLGTTSVRWGKLWVDDIQTTADINVGANLVVTGNFTVNGTTTTIATTNVVHSDFLIEINNGAASNANDMGIIMERGSTGDNAAFIWDESGDYFQVGTTTATGASTGNLTVVDAQLHAEGLVLSGTSSDLGSVTTIDINGGTIDGAAIGGAAAAAGAFTTVDGTLAHFTTSFQLATGATVTGILDEDAMGSDSDTQLATQQSIKAFVASLTPAPGIQMTWDTAIDDDDEGVGTIKADNATFASITQLFIDDVDNNSVSVNAFIDTLDDPTATNSAYIYLTKAGSASTAMKVFRVDGAVTSATTYSKVAVTGVVEVGSFNDGDVVGLMIAFSGDDGGGGTLDNIVEDTTPQYGAFMDTNSFFHSESQGANVASVAGDTDIWSAFDGNTVHITGTNAITDFGTPKQAGNMMWVIFDGAASVVDSATITCAGNVTFQAAANDLALVYALTTSTFLFMPFPNSGGSPVAVSSASTTVEGTVEVATQAEVNIGTDTLRSVSPATLAGSNFVGTKNLIINGDMRIAQRGTSFVGPSSGDYSLDRWLWIDVATGAAVTITQDTDAPTPAEAGTDFKFSLKIDCTTADASVAAGDLAVLDYHIEGFNTAHLGFGAANVATITAQFWVKSAKTGTHTLAFSNSASNRVHPATYSVSSANTWEKKTVTIVGDITGTWVGATNGRGLTLRFGLMGGTDFQGTDDVWNGANALIATGQVNVLDNDANNFLITGVQLEVGSVATAFEHRDYASELARCERYYQIVNQGGVGEAANATIVNLVWGFTTEMRAKPTITLIDTAPVINQTDANQTGSSSSLSTSRAGTTGFSCQIDGFTGMTGRNVCFAAQGNSEDFLDADAEL